MAREIADGITTDPAVMVGKRVIKGTRMPVELVLAKLAADPSPRPLRYLTFISSEPADEASLAPT